MNILRRPASLLTAFLCVFSFALFSPEPAKADTITISPPKFELFGNPGDTVTERLKVSNDGDSDVTYQTDVEDFQAAGDDGGINLIEDADAPTTNFSLAKWMTIEPSRFTVPAKSDRTITITIKIPKTGEPGGHYASVQVRLAGTPSVSGGASVESRLNSLILLRVSGNLVEKLELESFKTESSYYQKSPVNFLLKSKNTGNVHVAPKGTIVITDMFNRKVKELPLNQANVLPESSRSIKTVWDDTGKYGRFTATLVADYGQGGQQKLAATTTFIVFPLFLIWTILGIIVVLFLLITQRKRVKRFINAITRD